MLEVQRRQDRGDDVKGDHQTEAQVLVIDDHLEEQREYAQQRPVEQVHAEQALGVQPQLEVGVPTDELGDDRGEQADAQQHDHRSPQRRELGEQRHPVRGWRGVRDLRQAHLALLEHQLARFERDDDQHEEAHALVDHAHHQRGHGINRRAEHGVGAAVGAAVDVDHREQGEHEIGAAGDDAAKLHPGLHRELQPLRPWAEAPRRGGNLHLDTRGRVGGRGCFGSAGGRSCEAEATQTDDEERCPNAEPQRAVEAKRAAEADEFRVAFGGRPVAGLELKGAEAERIGERGEHVVVQIADVRLRQHVQHEKPRNADVGPQHSPGQGRQCEENGPHHQEVRRDEDDHRVHVGPQRERDQSLGVDPWHQRANGHANRGAAQRDDGGEAPAGEATEQVVGRADRLGIKQLVGVGLEVADHRAGGERRDEQDAEHAHDRQHLRDHVGGIDRRLPNATSDADGIRRHRAEAEQRKYAEEEPHRRLSKAHAHLEAEETEHRSNAVHQAARFRVAK